MPALILDVAAACTAVSKRVASGALTGVLGSTHATHGQGEEQQQLDGLAHDIFLEVNRGSGLLTGMASEELEEPFAIPATYPLGEYLLAFDPLEGSSNLDLNVAVGSIFSILRARSWEPRSSRSWACQHGTTGASSTRRAVEKDPGRTTAGASRQRVRDTPNRPSDRERMVSSRARVGPVDRLAGAALPGCVRVRDGY